MQHSDIKVYNNSGNTDVLSLVNGDHLQVFDVGCGAGSIARRLVEKGHIADGVTISAKELEEARKVLRNGYLYNLENGLPQEIPDNSYDVVICSHVLEHIAYPDKLIADIKRVLKKDGHLIVALPNVFYYKYRWQLMKGSFKTADAGIWDYTHLRWYSYKTAADFFKANNFELTVATVTGDLPFTSVLKHVLPATLRKGLYKGLTSISKGFFGYQLLYKLKNIK